MYTDLSHFLLIVIPFVLFCLNRETIHWISSIFYIVISAAFLGIILGYVCSDFSLFMTFTNSNPNTPLFYKISATWSNHEGSLLLWCWFLGFYAFLFFTAVNSNFSNWVASTNRTFLILFSDRVCANFQNRLSFVLSRVSTAAAVCLNKTHLNHFVLKTRGDVQSHRVAAETRLVLATENQNRVKTTEPQKLGLNTTIQNLTNCEVLDELEKKQKCCNCENEKQNGLKKRLKFGCNSFKTKVFNSSFVSKQNWSTESQNPFVTDFVFEKTDYSSVLKTNRLRNSTCSLGCVQNNFNYKIQKLDKLLLFSKTHKCVDCVQTFVVQLKTIQSIDVFSGLCKKTLFSKARELVCLNQNTHLIYLCILVWFICFLLWTSNPYLKIPFVCLTSITELNPVLQDPVLAIHPPCIYAGYVASALVFSFCLSFGFNVVRLFWLLKMSQVSNTIASLNRLWKTIKVSKLCFSECRKQNAETLNSTCFHNLFNQNLWILFSKCSRVRLQLCSIETRLNKLCFDIFTQIRVWMLTCWCLITIGILLGSWWAYHELGWGGWWFWDPVENASLMPWLLITAGIHSVKTTVFLCSNASLLRPAVVLNYSCKMQPAEQTKTANSVQNKTKQPELLHKLVEVFKSSLTQFDLLLWTLLLSIWTFLFSILGTFFVRSGVLTSVHSFATDSTRGLCLFFFFGLMFFLSHLLITAVLLNWTGFRLWKTICSNCVHKNNYSKSFASVCFGFKDGGQNHRSYNPSFCSCRMQPAVQPELQLQVENQNETTAPTAVTAATLCCPTSCKKQSTILRNAKYKQTLTENRVENVGFEAITAIQQLILMQNWLLALICFIVLSGTATPILFQWFFNRDVYTGALFFNTTIIPLWSCVMSILLYQHCMHLVKKRSYTKLQVQTLLLLSCVLLVIHVCYLFCSNRFGLLDSVYIALSLIVCYCLIISQKQNEFKLKPFNLGTHTFGFRLQPIPLKSFVKQNTATPIVLMRNNQNCVFCFWLCSQKTKVFSAELQGRSHNLTLNTNISAVGVVVVTLQHLLFRLCSGRATITTTENQNKVSPTAFCFTKVCLSALNPNYYASRLFCLNCVLTAAKHKNTTSLCKTIRVILCSTTKSLHCRVGFNGTINLETHCNSMVIAHAGVIILLLGIIMSYRYKTQSSNNMAFGTQVNLPVPTAIPPLNTNVFSAGRVTATQGLLGFVPKIQLFEHKHKIDCSSNKITTATAVSLPTELQLPQFFLTKQLQSNYIPQLQNTKENCGLSCVEFINSQAQNCNPNFRNQHLLSSAVRICCLRSIDKNYGPTFQSICGNFIIYEIPQRKPLLHNLCVTAVEFPKYYNYRKNNHFDYSFYNDCGYTKTETAVTAINQTTTGKIQSTGSMNTLCLFPEKRFITNNSNLASTTADGVNSTTASISKVAIHTNWFLDLYTLVGSGNIDGGWYTTIMQLPFMSCIWIGFVFGIYAGVNALQVCFRMRILSWQ